MKNNALGILIAVLLTGTITFFATRHFCVPQGAGDRIVRNDIPLNDFASHAFSKLTARQDIDSFQTVINRAQATSTNGLNTVAAYTIGLSDIIAAFGINLGQGWTSVNTVIRVYPGFDPNAGFKLFIVGVNETDTLQCGTCGTGFDTSSATAGMPKGGRDMFFDSGRQVVINPVLGKGNYVMDLIAPCPMTCDTASFLVQDIVSSVCCTCVGNQGYKKAPKK